MRGAVIIVIGLLVALVAFRRRGATTPLRLFDPKPRGGQDRPTPEPRPAGHPRGVRQAWRELVASFRRATGIITAVIIVYMVIVIWREFF